MYKHVKDSDSKFFKIIFADTGEIVKDCFEADDEKGEYSIRIRDTNNNLVLDRDENGKPTGVRKEKRKGNIRIVDIRKELI